MQCKLQSALGALGYADICIMLDSMKNKLEAVKLRVKSLRNIIQFVLVPNAGIIKARLVEIMNSIKFYQHSKIWKTWQPTNAMKL